MANFFEGIGNALKHPLDEAKWWGDVITGKTSLKDAPGKHQEMMNDITVPILGDNKISKNSDAVAGAVLGGIFAAPAMAGAFGGGSSAGAGTSFGGFGTEGAFSNYFKPTSIAKPGLGSDGVGWGGGSKLDLGLPTDYAGMKDMTSAEEGGFDFEALAKTLQSIKPGSGDPPINMTRTGGGGGGRYDKSVFENPLLTREKNALYSAPLYTPLG